jgi:hypothetical protein
MLQLVIANAAGICNTAHMRKRYVLLIAVLLLAFAVGLAWQLSQPREPMYEGRPLSYWLEGYGPDAATETSQQGADNAMQEIGTNAIPTLLLMLQDYNAPLKSTFFAFAEKQHFIKIRHVWAAQRNYQAMRGFKTLGPSSRIAIPALIEIYERNISDNSRDWTAATLGSFGPDAKNAVPALIKGMLSTNQVTRQFARNALREIHAPPEFILPTVIQAPTKAIPR